MFKSYRTILTVLLVVLVAGTAIAEKPASVNTYPTFSKLTEVENPEGRALYIMSYDFATGPVDYSSEGIQFGSQGILPAGPTMVAFGFEGIIADVYENDGASYSNWASEAWIGCTYSDAGVLSFVGVSPFDLNEGPGTFGPADVHFDFDGADWPLSTVEEFTFYANSSYDDGSGMAAGTITGGTVYVWIESNVVATDSATLDSVKALYR